MGEGWAVRPGRPEDTQSILELFRTTFGKSMSEAAYRWKYLESPWQFRAPTTFVAAAGDRIVAHLGGTPLRLRLGQHEVSAVQGCDVMVAPELRRHGIMSAVVRAANRAWADGGASLQLAVPTQNFDGLRERLDYRPTFRLGWLWRPLWLGALLSRKRGSVDVSRVDEPGAEFDVLWESVDQEGLVVRDRAWIAYRYVAAPGFDYQILLARTDGRPVGYLVYRVMEDRRSAWIADLFTAQEGHAPRRALVRAACRELRGARVHAVKMFAAGGTPLFRDLRRAGFLPRRGAYDVRVVPLAPDLPWDLLRDPRRFFVTGGDFDVV